MKPIEPRPISPWLLLVLALAVGVVAGFGAIVFRGMISGFHNLLFLGQFSFFYDATLHTAPSPWGPWVILVPVIGAIGVAFLVQTFAPEAKGHGVPEVVDAIYYHEGRIRPIVTVIKSIASALSIGSGGSVGREGPIVQIGAAFGSTLGQIIAMPTRQRNLLISAGAGAGITATFNTPFGGMLFAIELMMPVVNPLGLLVVGLCCVTATYIGQLHFGVLPAFDVPALVEVVGPSPPLASVPCFLVFGLIVGLAATLFVRAIFWYEDAFDALPGNYYTRHMLGMLLVGLLLYGFMTYTERLSGHPNHYYVEGVGYATILDVLSGRLTAPGFLLLLFAGKFVATCLTLGSGASGGIFSPCLFLGAALGGSFGGLVHQFVPEIGVSPVTFALAGMAGMVGGATGAIMTATVMLFEMTRDYDVVLPVLLTTVVAGAVRAKLSPPTIYTLKLLRRGHVVPQGLLAWLDGQRRAKDVMTGDFAIFLSDGALDPEPVRSAIAQGLTAVVAASDHHIRGVIDTWSEYEAPGSDTGLHRLHRTRYILVLPTDRYPDVLRAMDQAGARVALVMRTRDSKLRDDLLGVIADRHVAALARSSAKLTG